MRGILLARTSGAEFKSPSHRHQQAVSAYGKRQVTLDYDAFLNAVPTPLMQSHTLTTKTFRK
jgi:hypothetical protein